MPLLEHVHMYSITPYALTCWPPTLPLIVSHLYFLFFLLVIVEPFQLYDFFE